jgi:rhamnosyltransferase
LIASADIVKKYQYVCFIHDKKEHKAIYKKDTELWIENLWGNLIGSEYYIRNLLQLFEDNPTLGILAPPAPIGDSANAWYGFGWYRSFDITKTLAQKLELKADIDINKPPITLGTALWFRTKALEKLYTLNWRYSDFDDDKLKNQNYLSYGVERIFAYVAQDAGFDTGEVMTLEYAQKQNSYLQYSTAKIFAETEKYFPFLSIFCLERYRPNVDRLIRFAKENEKILLYGYGNMGSFCLETLRRNGIQNVEAFLASNVSGDKMHDGVKVIQIDELDHYEYHEAGVVITVADTGIQDDMVERLKEKDIDNYMIFCM